MRVNNEQAMFDFSATFAQQLQAGQVIFLKGDLGAGKTTFVRGVLRALGHQGKVKSPTYNLVECYEINDQALFHFDLYRLEDPEELEFLGIRDYLNENSISFIEWPSRGEGILPESDIDIEIEIDGTSRVITVQHRKQKIT